MNDETNYSFRFPELKRKKRINMRKFFCDKLLMNEEKKTMKKD